jgi:hypothetical protein
MGESEIFGEANFITVIPEYNIRRILLEIQVIFVD